MAVTTVKSAEADTHGKEIFTGTNYSIIGAAGTDTLLTGKGKVAQLLVSAVGTTWVIDIYDNSAGSGNKVFSYLTAMGTGVFALQCPMATGITLVSSGTPGTATIVWSNN